MATFTTVTKPRLSWQAPAVGPNTNKYLLIGGGYYLNIGGGFKLIIQSAVGRTPWSNVDKSQ